MFGCPEIVAVIATLKMEGVGIIARKGDITRNRINYEETI